MSESKNRVWVLISADLIIGFAMIALFLFLVHDYYIAYFGFAIGGMLAVVISFGAPFPSGLDQGNGGPSLADMAHRLKSNGFKTEEKPRSVIIHFNRWVAVDLRYQKRGNGSRLIYRLDAPPSTLGVILFLFLTVGFSFLAIPLGIFLLTQMDRNARRFLLPFLRSEPRPVQTPQNTIKDLLLESLSECRRLVEEAYRGTDSAYQDYVLIDVIVIGLIGWLVLLVIIMQLPLFDFSNRLVYSALLALAISVVGCTIAVFLTMKKLKPKVIALQRWVFRLDTAIVNELSNRMPEGDESSIELLFSAFDEMPSWLSARRKTVLDRHPASYILSLMLALWGSSTMFSGFFGLFFATDQISSVLSISIGGALLAGSFWLRRWTLKKEIVEEKWLAQEWARRKEQLRMLLNLHFGENNDA